MSKERKGYRSAKNGHLGVYTLCSGPDPSGPVPGERVIIVIYDKDNNIARRLEQVRGDCVDGGWIDFFNSFKCRPAMYEYHIVDTDKEGYRKILATHTDPYFANAWFRANVPNWVAEHGIEEEEPNLDNISEKEAAEFIASLLPGATVAKKS